MEHRLKAEVFAIGSLSNEQQEMMFSLYSDYYEDFKEALFYQDLADKHWAIILTDQQGVIRGFSTMYIGDYQVDGQAIRSVFSGDTIIHHDFWGEQSLPIAWCRFIGELKAQQADIPLYWFLIVKGHRTYRYLRVFSKVFYPVYSNATPNSIQAIMDHLGSNHFGQQYSPDTGLIRFNESHGYLKKEWAGVDQPALKKRDVQFFVERNPGYQAGDELVCLTELTEDNLQRYALSAFREGVASMQS